MDLNSIGKHCASQSCNALDFLPIQCSCLRWFCKLHISPDLHDCDAVQQRHSPVLSSSAQVRLKCAFSACDKLCLETGADSTLESESRDAAPKGCPGCHLSFCVDHRHMQSHACPGLVVSNHEVKHKVARVLLAQKFSATAASTSHTPVVTRQRRGVSSDPQKLAQLQQVNQMRLRHKAVQADPNDKGSTVPIDQRIHVTVSLEISGQSTKQVALWFRKTTITGKALDLLVQHFGLSHKTSPFQLKQSSAETESHLLQNHLQLSAQLQDGSTVVLTDSRSNE